MCTRTARIARRRPRRSSACAACAGSSSREPKLSQAQKNANQQKSKVRARIEHVFGAQRNSPGGRIVRIGLVRAGCRTSPTTSAGWRRWKGWLPFKEGVRPEPHNGRRAALIHDESRSKNDCRGAAAVGPRKNALTFDVPFRILLVF
jgi:hypothetical protein